MSQTPEDRAVEEAVYNPSPERLREAVALVLRDALRCTEPDSQLDPDAFEVVADGIGLLVGGRDVTLADEEKLNKDLLRAGWFLTPAADSPAVLEFRQMLAEAEADR